MKSDFDIGQVRTILRLQSKLDFGRLNRFEVAFAVSALDDPIWGRRVAELLGLPENQVIAELAWLLETGALAEFPVPHDRRRLYQLAPHEIWAYVRAVGERRILESEDGETLLGGYWAAICDEGPRVAPARTLG